MEILFENWHIRAPQDAVPQQYDNGVWELVLTGELPEGWSWQALIAQGEKLDIMDLAASEQGASATLSAKNLALSGPYTIQIRGTKGEKIRYTEMIRIYVPRSLSGDATWPEVPTEFSQMEDRIRVLAEHPPIPGDGYWMIWDMDAGMYQKSNFRLTVDPVEKDAGMTEPVGVDGDGKLWAKPGGGSGGAVTAEVIAQALGYIPADQENVPDLPNESVLCEITGVVTPEKLRSPDHVTDLVQYGAFQIAANQILAQIPTVPTALKNPNALTVKIGSNSVVYDGSEAKTVEIADGSETAHIVESGTDGIWTWRKYSDGTAECWGTLNVGNVTQDAFTAWGSWYSATISEGVAFPFPFTSVPSLTREVSTPVGAGIGMYITPTAESTGRVSLVRPNTNGVTGIKISFHAQGRWKQ